VRDTQEDASISRDQRCAVAIGMDGAEILQPNGRLFDRLAHIVWITVAAKACKWNSADFAMKSA
jgi:hypothetical protein